MTLQSLDNSLEEIKPSCSRTNTESDSDDGDSSLPELKLAKILDVVQSKKVPVQAQYNTINQSSDVKFGDEWHLHFHGVKITGEASDKPSSRSSEEIPVSNHVHESGLNPDIVKLITTQRACSEQTCNKHLFGYKELLIIIMMMTLFLAIMAWLPWYNQPPKTDSAGNKIADEFVVRKNWAAEPPKGNLPLRTELATLVVIKHTGGPNCLNYTSCKSRVKEIQQRHMQKYKYPDIAYNFLIGGDARVYEGRGWDTLNEGRSDSVDIAFIGNFTKEVPNDNMVESAKWLTDSGWKENKIDYHKFHVVSDNQTQPTDSPGSNLVAKLPNWFNHYNKDTVCFSDCSNGSYLEYNPCPYVEKMLPCV